MSARSEFTKLLAGSFISQCGSHFLTLALSAVVLDHSGSLIKASIVFVLSYLPSVFFSSRLGSWIDRNISKKVLIGNECLAVVASLLCGLSLQFSTMAFCIVLAIRSIFLFSSRALSAKWLKLISPAEVQGARIKISFLIFFLATAVSGVLASYVLGSGSVWAVIAVDALTYLLGGIVFLSLKKLPARELQAAPVCTISLSASLRAITRLGDLRKPFLRILLSQCIFQSAYSVLVNYLPIYHFRIGIGGTGIFQIAASIGIIGGFCYVWKCKGSRLHSKLSYFWYAGILGLLATICLPLVGSLSGFVLLNFFYEAIWLDATASFFERSPEQRLAEFQFTLNSVAAFCMGLTTLVYASNIQLFGSETISYVGIISLIIIGSWRVGMRNRSLSGIGGVGK